MYAASLSRRSGKKKNKSSPLSRESRRQIDMHRNIFLIRKIKLRPTERIMKTVDRREDKFDQILEQTRQYMKNVQIHQVLFEIAFEVEEQFLQFYVHLFMSVDLPGGAWQRM